MFLTYISLNKKGGLHTKTAFSSDIKSVLRVFLHGVENLRPERASEERLEINANPLAEPVRQLNRLLDDARRELAALIAVHRDVSDFRIRLGDALSDGWKLLDIGLGYLDLHLHLAGVVQLSKRLGLLLEAFRF